MSESKTFRIEPMRRDPQWNSGNPKFGIAKQKLFGRDPESVVEFQCLGSGYGGTYRMKVGKMVGYPIESFKGRNGSRTPPLYMVPVADFEAELIPKATKAPKGLQYPFVALVGGKEKLVESAADTIPDFDPLPVQESLL